MESWLLGTQTHYDVLEGIQALEPDRGKSTSPLCHSLFLCLQTTQPLSPCLSFPPIKSRTVIQIRGHTSKNHLISAWHTGRVYLKEQLLFSWLAESSSFQVLLVLSDNLQKTAQVEDMSEVKGPSSFPLTC